MIVQIEVQDDGHGYTLGNQIKTKSSTQVVILIEHIPM